MKQIKRGIAWLLCLTMLMSQCVLYVGAAGDTTRASSNGAGALESLGFNTSEAPEGYDEDSPNPYGRNTVTLNPVQELYTVGFESDRYNPNKYTLPEKIDSDESSQYNKSYDRKLLGTLYGHNATVSSSTKASNVVANPSLAEIASGKTTLAGEYIAPHVTAQFGIKLEYKYLQSAKAETRLGSEGNTWDMALSSVASGNFNGNADGKKAQAVMIYTGALDKQGGMYMRIGDVDGTKGYGDAKALISVDKSIGNPDIKAPDSDEVVENFQDAPYLMQNYLQVTTGDYNNDGTDDIAVYIPELNNSRIEVYSLKKTSGSGDTSYLNSTNWSLAWTYPLNEQEYVSNMVSLVSGDFNRDGVDDIAGTWGYYYGPEEKNESRAVVMFGEASSMLTEFKEFPLNGVVRGAFASGDFLGTGSDTLVLGGQKEEDINNRILNSRYVALYTWNGNTFAPFMEKNIIRYGTLYSSPLCVANIDVLEAGPGKAGKIYLDSLLVTYDEDNGLFLSEALDTSRIRQDYYYGDGYEPYVEYGAQAGDLVGSGQETLVTMHQTLSKTKMEEVKGTLPYNENFIWSDHSYFPNWYFFASKTPKHAIKLVEYNSSNRNDVTETMPMYSAGQAYLSMYHTDSGVSAEHATPTAVDLSMSLCMPNTDDDTSVLNYTGKHYFTYSDPKILAVIASAPYFNDLLERNDLTGNYGESQTTYSSTKGSSGGETYSNTLSVGTYVSMEQEFSLFGFDCFSAEAEMELEAAFTYEFESNSDLEQTITYDTAAGQDSVAFYSIPVEMYEYTALLADGNGGFTEQTMVINVPHQASIKLLALSDYENAAADYPGLPQISDNVLTHTLGDPSTYPSASNGYAKAISYEGTPSSVGFGGSSGSAAITQEIAMSTSEAKSYSASTSMSFKAGAGAGGLTLGVTAGVAGSTGTVETTTAGSSFSGTIQNMPEEARPYGYGFNWRIFSFEYEDEENDFPVVSYLVTGVTAPPKLPDNFSQDMAASTSDTIELVWSSDSPAAAYTIYRYFDFPDGSGTNELATVSLLEGVPVENSDKTITYHFRYVDKGLSPDTTYNYQIQAARAAVPTASIYSETMNARTKPDTGYPIITLTGPKYQNNVLPIYHDSDTTMTATVEKPEGVNGEYKYMSFQWQLYRNNAWTDINGENAASLTFKNAGTSVTGDYRCRVNTIFYSEDHGKQYTISAYSETFHGEYSKRTASVEAFDVTGSSTSTKDLDVLLKLQSKDETVSAKPTGTVTFSIVGEDYNVAYTVELKSCVAQTKMVNLPDGVYEVSAQYNGDLNYKGLTIEDSKIVIIGKAAAYLLELTANEGTDSTSQFVYGDQIKATVSELKEEDGELQRIGLSSEINLAYKLDGKSVDEGSWSTPKVGTHTLTAILTGEAISEVKLSRTFTVSKRSITVEAQKLPNAEASDTAPAVNEIIQLAEGSKMAFEESFEALKLTYSAKNAAGNVVDLSKYRFPGNYEITPMPTNATPANIYSNYDVSYVSAVYTIIGAKYQVSYEAMPVGDVTAGTLVLRVKDVDAGNKYSASTNLTFIATPYEGYEVAQWRTKSGNGDYETVMVGTEPLQALSYQKQLLSEDFAVQIVFAERELELKTRVSPANSGRVSPNYTTSVIASIDAPTTFKAIPAEGYHFLNWSVSRTGFSQESYAGTPLEDGSNTLDFVMGNEGTTVYAMFERDSYVLTLDGDLEATYTRTVNEQEVKEVVESGAEIVGGTMVTIQAKSGYCLVADAIWYQDELEIPESAGEESVDIYITADTTIKASTENEKYDISTSADAEMGAITLTLDGEQESANPALEVEGGTAVVLQAVAHHGYLFDYWNVNGVIDSTGDTLLFAALGKDITVTAYFKKDTARSVTVELGGLSEDSKVLYTQKDKLNRTIAENEEYSAETKITVYDQDKITIAIAPAAMRMVEKWTVNDVVDQSSASTKTFTINGENLDVLVDMKATVKLNVHYSAGENGVLVVTDATGAAIQSGQRTDGGNDITFSATPAQGYMVGGWIVNDAPLLNDEGTAYVDATFILEGLGENVVAQVTFIEEATYDVAVDGDDNITIAKAVSPDYCSSTSKVRAGATFTLTLTPTPGYTPAITQGAEAGDLTQNADGTYTFTVASVDSDLSIKVVAQSQNAALKSLAIDGAELTPIFAADTSEYTASVDYSTASVDVTAAAMDNATIVGGGTYALIVGDNKIEIQVTAEDGVTVKTYTITVTRKIDETTGGTTGGGTGGGSAVIEPKDTVEVLSPKNGKVTIDNTAPKSGETVVITVKPDNGYQLDELVIRDADGKKIEYTENADGTYSITYGKSAVTIDATFVPVEDSTWFIDVLETDWFYDSIKFVHEHELFNGISEEIFSPNGNMTRAMMVQVLYNLSASDATDKTDFSDVDEDAWYYDAVAWAAENEIVSGIGNNAFAPNADVTREQMALILFNYCKKTDITLPIVRDAEDFADADDISSWAKEAVIAMYQTGIINGRPGFEFDPGSQATRAEVATLFMGFQNVLDEIAREKEELEAQK